MRIRTDGDYAHRMDAIERAARFYDCTKTRAVGSACEAVAQLSVATRQVLGRDDHSRAAPRDRRDTLDESRHL